MSIESLTQYGILGIVLGWFMFRLEKKLDQLDKTLQELKDAIGKKA